MTPAENKPERFYKYLSASTAKIVLANSTLRWGSPLSFNDIFDVPTELAAFSATEIATASINFALDQFAKMGLRELSSEQRVEALAVCSLAPLLTAEEISRAEVSLENFRKQWRDEVPRMRILCLCTQPDVAAMWGLYADSNKGVVLRFDSLSAFDPPWLAARPVTYSDILPRFMRPEGVMEAVLAGPQSLFAELCFKKTTDWSHEREWRVLSWMMPGDSGLTSDWPFFPETLTEVVLGPRISKEDRAEIEGLMARNFPHARLSQAMPSQTNQILIQPAQ